jgi:hypothetical protein
MQSGNRALRRRLCGALCTRAHHPPTHRHHHHHHQDQSYLTAGCLDGQLKFFSSSGSPKFKEWAMEGDPLSLAHLNAEYLLAAGSDK